MDDFDSWDRCISRGFPASMFPFRYNYGQRIWQAPGYVVIELEMLGTRVIPLGNQPKLAGPDRGLDGQQPRPLGRQDAGHRDEQHQVGRQRDA